MTDKGGPDQASVETAEQALAELKLHQELLANLAEGVAVVRVSDLQIVEANPALFRLLGHEPDAEITAALAENSTLTRELAGVREGLEREGRWSGLVEITRADGSAVWCQVTISTAHHPVHRAVWLAVISDRTEAVGAERELLRALDAERESVSALREADRRKDDLLSALAHELRSPLTTIAGFVDLLRRPDVLPPERHDEAILRTGLAAQEMAILVDDLSDSLRLGAGQITIAPRPIALRGEVDAQVKALAELSEGRRVDVDIADTVVVQADPIALARILVNLIAHAVRTGSVASLHIRAAAKGTDLVRVEVDEREPIPTAARRGGSALGLRIIRDYVELHGGEVGFEGDNDRILWFTLPAAEVPGG